MVTIRSLFILVFFFRNHLRSNLSSRSFPRGKSLLLLRPKILKIPAHSAFRDRFVSRCVCACVCVCVYFMYACVLHLHSGVLTLLVVWDRFQVISIGWSSSFTDLPPLLTLREATLDRSDQGRSSRARHDATVSSLLLLLLVLAF